MVAGIRNERGMNQIVLGVVIALVLIIILAAVGFVAYSLTRPRSTQCTTDTSDQHYISLGSINQPGANNTTVKKYLWAYFDQIDFEVLSLGMFNGTEELATALDGLRDDNRVSERQFNCGQELLTAPLPAPPLRK